MNREPLDFTFQGKDVKVVIRDVRMNGNDVLFDLDVLDEKGNAKKFLKTFKCQSPLAVNQFVLEIKRLGVTISSFSEFNIDMTKPLIGKQVLMDIGPGKDGKFQIGYFSKLAASNEPTVPPVSANRQSPSSERVILAIDDVISYLTRLKEAYR